MRTNPLLIAILAVLLLVGCVGMVVAKDANESALKIKTIGNPALPTEDQSIKSVADFSQREHRYENGAVQLARAINGKLYTTITATPRASGGVTLELFCQDNTGRYMPTWGGSITKETSAWSFSLKDIQKDNVDGCYFGVVDSTTEIGGN